MVGLTILCPRHNRFYQVVTSSQGLQILFFRLIVVCKQQAISNQHLLAQQRSLFSKLWVLKTQIALHYMGILLFYNLAGLGVSFILVNLKSQ